MNTIAIFCRTLDEGGDPFTSDYYWQAYQDLLLALKARGVHAYFATDNNAYLGDGMFETVYTMDSKVPLSGLVEVKNVKVDLVFDRGGFIGQGVNVLNSPFFQKIARDKTQTYEHFARFQPFSIAVRDKGDLLRAFSKIDGENIVVKEPVGMGGYGVYIGLKDEMMRQIPEDGYPLLVQEFMDTSQGVPGRITGVHDVRLSICGGEIIGYYARKAKAGSLHSNVSQGGKMVFFEVEDIPVEVCEMALAIDSLFAEHPRYYSADFINTPKGWKLIEINRYLALLPVTDGKRAQQTLDQLADYLVGVCVKGVANYQMQ